MTYSIIKTVKSCGGRDTQSKTISTANDQFMALNLYYAHISKATRLFPQSEVKRYQSANGRRAVFTDPASGDSMEFRLVSNL